MSLCDKIYRMKKGVRFRNVIGSSEDPKYQGMAWLRLLQQKQHMVGKNQFCCACKMNVATVGGHIILGDGIWQGHESAEAESLMYGKRVFIAPICKSCNAKDYHVFDAKYDVNILHLYAFFVDGEYDEGSFTAWYYANNDNDDIFEKELQKNRTEYGTKLRFLHELGEGLLQEDADILKRSPASTKAEPSEPAYRVDDFGMVYGDTRAFQRDSMKRWPHGY